jgi:CBS domain-containing protein
MATVQSMMKMRLLTAEPHESVAGAARKMRDLNLGAVLVVAGSRLTGIFSERDLLCRVVAEGRDPERTALSEVATPDPVTVPASASIRRCAELIRERGFRHLPVVDGEGRPVGILSTRDFLQFVVAELEEAIDRERREARLEELTDPFEVEQPAL